MHWPQIIFVGYMAIELLWSAHKHGDTKSELSHNFWSTAGVVVGLTLVLWWGGFFANDRLGVDVAIAPYPDTPPRQGELLSFHPDSNDFKFHIFYLGSTQEEVRKNCDNNWGKIAGTIPDALAGPGMPVCYMEHDDGVTDGYYPVYWPKN